ncbi:MAG: hypothetical protein IJ735_07105 [Clostridia bacterium]|nr:hypothetical protein [Clostridia bacterium]
MKFTAFASSCVGKALLVILCILIGIVLAVGGEALAGYIVLTREGMVGVIGDAIQSNLGEDSELQVQFDDETRAMSLLQWGSGLVGAIGDMGDSTVGGLEKLIGLNILSSTVEDIVGVDAEIIKESTLSDMGKTITDNLTLSLARDKFGIEFPDMPLFNDEEFLAKPLSTAFESLDDYSIGDIIEIREDAHVILKKMQDLKINELGGDKTTEIINDTELGEVIDIDEYSNAVLRKLQHTKIGELGGEATTDAINDMELGEVIDIDEYSNAVLQELQHTKIGDLGGSTTNETINGMFLFQIMTIDEHSPKTMRSLKYATIESVYEVDEDGNYVLDGTGNRVYKMKTVVEDGVEHAYPMKGISETIDDMTLGEAIEIDEHSNAVLQELAPVKINELGGSKTDETINSMFLGQIMEIGDDSPEILKNIKYASIESVYEEDGITYKTKYYDGEDRPLKGISETIDALYVKDVVEITEASSAVLRKMRTPTEEEIAAGKAGLFGTENMLVSDLGGSKVIDLINDTTIGEIIEVNDGSEPIMKALKDTKIGGLNSRMQTLELAEIFAESELSSGALSLIDPHTTLQNIPSAVTTVMFNATVATMVGKGIIDSDSMSEISNMKYQQQSFMYNSNMSDMLSGVINFINDPYTIAGMTVTLNYGHISPKAETIDGGNFESLKSFVATYSQYSTVELTGPVNLEVDPTEDAGFYDEEGGFYVLPLFNIKNAGIIHFSGSETVKLGVLDVDNDAAPEDVIAVDSEGNKYVGISRNQYGFAYVNEGCSGYFNKGYSDIMFHVVSAGDIE